MSRPEDIPGADTALTRAASWRDLVAVYNESVGQVRQSIETLHVAVDRMGEAFALGGRDDFRLRNRHGDGIDLDADVVVDRLKRNAWEVIVDRLELHRMMSVSKWEALQRDLQKGDMPDLTEANVRAFVRQYETQLPELLSDMVAEVYDWLRPRCEGVGAGAYKTNSREEIGRKVVLTWMVARWDHLHHGYWKLHWSGRPGQQLIALENVFHALDGRGSIAKTNRSAVETALLASTDGRGETPYFRFKAFKNGNLHIEFRRLDLLARFNQIAGGKRLRQGKAA